MTAQQRSSPLLEGGEGGGSPGEASALCTCPGCRGAGLVGVGGCLQRPQERLNSETGRVEVQFADYSEGFALVECLCEARGRLPTPNPPKARAWNAG